MYIYIHALYICVYIYTHTIYIHVYIHTHIFWNRKFQHLRKKYDIYSCVIMRPVRALIETSGASHTCQNLLFRLHIEK